MLSLAQSSSTCVFGAQLMSGIGVLVSYVLRTVMAKQRLNIGFNRGTLGECQAMHQPPGTILSQ